MKHLLAAATALVVSTSPVLAKGPFGSISIGGWKGGAYTNDRTGAFTGCLASVPYRSGITLGVRIDASLKEWALAFINQSWQLSEGSTFPIALTFDGSTPTHVSGRVIGQHIVYVDMPDTSQLIGQFRRAKVMTAFAQGQLFQFSLDGTSVVLPSLVNCVTTTNRVGIANVGNFNVQRPVLAAAPPSSAPATPAPTPSLRSNGAASAELQIEAIELATNFMLKTNMPNSRVVSRGDTPASLISDGAAWQSDEASGFVKIIPASDNATGLDVAAAVVAGDAKDCKAKFASGRTTELVDATVVFRGMSSCEDSDGIRSSNYFIVARKKGGFILFSVVAGQKSQVGFNEAKKPEERLTDFRKAALVVTGH